MRPVRALLPIIRREGPVRLAREFAWQTWKQYRKKHRLALIRTGNCPVRFRNVPYYVEGAPQLGPSTVHAITAVADMVSRGEFPFLSYPTAPLGLPPAWNVDFLTGEAWPMTAVGTTPYVRYGKADVKVPWELSRMQILPVLGKACRLTRSEKYRNAAKELVADWISKNPVGVGPNWAIAMEPALRAISMCLVASLLWPFRPEEQAWLDQLTRSLWEHLLYTEATLEFSHIVRGNHYLSNIVGLLCMSVFLQGPAMEQRQCLYRDRVRREILHQVYEDGGDYEASTGYHVLVTQLFTTALLLMRAAGLEAGVQYERRLIRMFNFIAEIADERGRLPHVGDCDDGRTELLTDDLRQMLVSPSCRHTLTVPNLLGTGEQLLGETLCATKFEDAAWHSGRETQSKSLPRSGRVQFPESGISVARAGNAELLFFAMPNGIHGKGSHTHGDKLSIVLRIAGEELLCDCGTGVYTRHPEVRNQFRSTAWHNTLMVDGEEQNRINPDPRYLFCSSNDAIVSRIQCVDDGAAIVFRASHEGYRRLGVQHSREVALTDSELRVEDRVAGEGQHAVEINYFFAAPWTATLDCSQGGELSCRIEGPMDVRAVISSAFPLQAETEAVDISRAYGSALVRGTRLRCWGSMRLPTALLTRLEWSSR
jgi:hypothetical protein